ncbi:MAG TPA: hypothetical protein VJ806_11610, partial [Luteimonas sp.]|nr:hypothetical protein [Luteimonas sp.]
AGAETAGAVAEAVSAGAAPEAGDPATVAGAVALPTAAFGGNHEATAGSFFARDEEPPEWLTAVQRAPAGRLLT